MIDLNALEALANAATPGPWRNSRLGEASGFEHVFSGIENGPGQTVSQWTLPADAAFIAASRTAIPALIAEVRALRATLTEALDLAARLSRNPAADDRIAALRVLAEGSKT